MSNRFIPLNEINVNDHTKEKNGLTYLSWSWAWAEMMKHYPDSFYTVYKDENNNLYHTDGRTCWIEASFTLVDGDYKKEIIEYLPIMDYRNNSIPLDKVTSRDVTDTIQRCVTKAIARHGLGCYIYQGEGLPEESEDTKNKRIETEKKIAELKNDITKKGKALTAELSNEDKVQFFSSVFVPIVGDMNHNTCNDVDKLQMLVNKLDEMSNSVSEAEEPKKSRKKAAA